jgi:hypothetical protein
MRVAVVARTRVESLGSVPKAGEGAATATKVVEVNLQGLQNTALGLNPKMQFHDLVPNCLSRWTPDETSHWLLSH